MDEQCKPEGDVELHKTLSVCSRLATDSGKGAGHVKGHSRLRRTAARRRGSAYRAGPEHPRSFCHGFEYLNLIPGLPEFNVKTGERIRQPRTGYSASIGSRLAHQKCREFEDPEQQSRALDVALATLGNEGWEMVTVADQTGSQGSPQGPDPRLQAPGAAVSQ